MTFLIYVSFLHKQTRNNSLEPCYIIGLRWPSPPRHLYQFLLVQQPEVCMPLSLYTQIYIFKFNNKLRTQVSVIYHGVYRLRVPFRIKQQQTTCIAVASPIKYSV